MDDPISYDDILTEFDTTGAAVLNRRWVHTDHIDEPIGFEAYTNTSGAGSGTQHAMYADRQGSILYAIDPATQTTQAARFSTIIVMQAIISPASHHL